MNLQKLWMVLSSHKHLLLKIYHQMRYVVGLLLSVLLTLSIMFFVGTVAYVLYQSMPKLPEVLVWSPPLMRWMVWFVVSLYLSILLVICILHYPWKRLGLPLVILVTKLKQVKMGQNLLEYQHSRRYRLMKEAESGQRGTQNSKE